MTSRFSRLAAARSSRYVIVGGVGYVVNLATLLLLVRVAGVDEFIALFPAYVLNTASNFLLNRHWTFGADGRGVVGDGARFLVVAAVLLVWNYVTFYLLFVTVGLPDAVAQTISILLGLPLGYTLNRRWAFAASSAAEA